MKLRKIILGVFASMTIINLFGCNNEFEKKYEGNADNSTKLESIQFEQNNSKEIVKNIDCDIDTGNIKIEEGDEFSVKAENVRKGACKVDIKQDTLEIKYNYKTKSEKLKITKGKLESFTIVIPKNIELKNIDIDLGEGNIVDNTKSTNVENTIFDVGCGNITNNNLNSKNVKIDIGAGDLNLAGRIEELMNIGGGTGDITLNIKNTDLNEYNLKCDTGIGSISVNDKSYGTEYERESNECNKAITVDLGVGNIKINN